MGLGLVDKPHLQRFKDKLDVYLTQTFMKKNAVSATAELETGTQIGSVTINGTTTVFYAPPAGDNFVQVAGSNGNENGISTTVTVTEVME